MYSDFLLRNDLFDLIDNKPGYNKDNITSLEESIDSENIAKLFKKTLKQIFPYDDNDLIYSSHKSLDQPPFNSMYNTSRGLHAFRRYFSQVAHEKRCEYGGGGNEQFDKEGLVIVEKFTSARLLKSAREEFDIIREGVNKQHYNIIGLNQTTAPILGKISEQIYPHITKCLGLDNDEVRTKYHSNTFAQRVRNKPGDGDHQKVAHVDTFFPAIKWWWFPDQVRLEHGPLNYAKGSCYPTDTYLDWILQESMNVLEGKYPKWKGNGHKEGSFRASEEDLIAMEFELEPIIVKANTLVIANVAGFHSRGEVETEYTRNAIHGSIRLDKPFEW